MVSAYQRNNPDVKKKNMDHHPSKFGTGNGTSIVTPKKYSQFWDFSTLGRHGTVLRFSFCGKNSSTNFYRQPYPPTTPLKHLSRPQIIFG